MNSSPEISGFAMKLLKQDEPLSQSDYKEYRMKLENALTSAERREKLAGRVAGVSVAVSVVLMFVGGSNLLGSIDPWSKDATMASMALGVVFVLATLSALFSLATYYSQFRPQVRDVKEQLRDASILALHGELSELRKQVAMNSRRDESG